MRTPRPRNLSDYQRILSTSGEVAIGAYARHQRRQRIAVGLFGVLLIGGAVALYLYLAPTRGEEDPGVAQVLFACIKCGRQEVRTLDPAESLPLACPVCSERTLWPMWHCRDCDHIFSSPGGAAVVCPKCASRRVGSAAPPNP